MKMVKRNQIVIFVVALMLMAAGYLSYSSKEGEWLATGGNVVANESYAGIGDAKLVSNNDVIEAKDEINNTIKETQESNQRVEEQENQSNAQNKEEGQESSTEAKQVSSSLSDEYFVNSRLGRDTMYSQMIESYQKILENQNISQEQKAIATQEISNINQTKNAIMIVENLIKTKGISDVVIFCNDKSINAIVKAEKLEQEQIAQIQNIIAREMKAEIENIHISNK